MVPELSMCSFGCKRRMFQEGVTWLILICSLESGLLAQDDMIVLGWVDL